jgi:hypothetical protein
VVSIGRSNRLRTAQPGDYGFDCWQDKQMRTSTGKYHNSLRNNPEEVSSQLLRDRSLLSRIGIRNCPFTVSGTDTTSYSVVDGCKLDGV